ncbi:MAG: SAF domain-containing protein [Actinobacteria bacterium]|nr:SAF domain-containing protein [Actinomycetota bacterium]
MTRRNGAASPDSANRAARQATVAGQKKDPVRRRWGRIGGGVFAAVVGGWLFASLYLSADDRVEVLAVASDIGRFDVIDRSDLRVVTIGEDTDVASIPASRLDELVGRVASTDIVAGGLLVDGQLLPAGDRLVTADEAIVGVLVGPGDSPTTGMTRGAVVSVVIRPAAGTNGTVAEVPGWIAGIGGEVSSSGDRPVEVVVARSEAARVSAAAADRRVTIVVLGD